MLLSLLITIIQVCLIIFSVEWMYRGSIFDSITWLKEFPKQFWYNFIILFLFFYSLQLFKRKLWVFFSFLFTIPLFLLAIACNLKQEIRGEPVLPSDLILGAEAFNMLDFFSENLLMVLSIVFLVVAALIVYIIYRVPNQKSLNKIPIFVSALIFIIFVFIFNNETKNTNTFLKEKLNVEYFPWDQKMTYQHDGVVASFIINLKWLSIEMPKGYSKKTLEKIIEDVTVLKEGNEKEKPNIIVLMSEAFWDPVRLENVQFNKDPIPFFRQLQEVQSSGYLNVPVFGGSTVNTEMEFLTSISMQLLPAGSIAYLQYVKKPIPSIPFILKKYGYDTTAIHTWHHWFYNRSQVYKLFGFDNFISLEFMDNVIDGNPYIHDQTLTDQILKKLNNNNEKPNFIFAVSTQNHGPYSTDEKKPFANIEVDLLNSKKGFSKESENILEVYSDNLTEVDKQLKRLITEIDSMQKKTIVVFFGDHLPLLGEDYQVYRESGYFQNDNTYQDYINMYSTPYIIWDNFSGKKNNNNIGTILLGPILLDRAGIEGNNLTNYLISKFNNGTLKNVPRSDFLKKEKMDLQVFNDLNLLQYDVLFGEMYGVNKETLNSNKNFRLGHANPKIRQASIEKTAQGESLIIKGEYFTKFSNVYVNGDKFEKDMVTDSEIHVPYSAENGGEIKILIKIVDSNGSILLKSNEYVIK